ncbi:hypothetical protein SAMN05421493_11825 [Pseudobutyrivibrio sp. 49]|uniref:hypothetical protein n=1 Tax=Pseudobutyrivibrio sp. 49 TaxID=1855344 RepID=UPI000883F1FF|nr:hypothetical protein [Pseudobutyrivibrio sp. 49]SDI56448.1 hypothetical protein SAMN05421493_11825 [Pseudobutyrivibrio sp. 49]
MEYSLKELRQLLRAAISTEEVKKIRGLIPKVNFDQQKVAHHVMNDGIYDEDRILIGEKRPED